MIAKREEFAQEAELLAAYAAGLWGDSPTPAQFRERVDSLSRTLERAAAGVSEGDDADRLIDNLLNEYRVRIINPHCGGDDDSIRISDQLRGICAVLEKIKGAAFMCERPRSAFLHQDLVALAQQFELIIKKIPTATAADSSRKKARRESDFEKIARAFCKAAGFRGMRHTTFVAAMDEYRAEKARGSQIAPYWR
jgi:hypothetical protein